MKYIPVLLILSVLIIVTPSQATEKKQVKSLNKEECMVHSGSNDIVCCQLGQKMTFYDKKTGNALLVKYKSFKYKGFIIQVPPEKNLIGGCRRVLGESGAKK